MQTKIKQIVSGINETNKAVSSKRKENKPMLEEQFALMLERDLGSHESQLLVLLNLLLEEAVMVCSPWETILIPLFTHLPEIRMR